MTVYVVEEGHWSDRCVVLIATSVVVALRALKAMFPAPYRVHWDEPKTDKNGDVMLVGHFEAVGGLSTEHSAIYNITPTKLVSSVKEDR